MALTGRILIDGMDAFTRYGMVLDRKSYAELLKVPSFKKVDTNDWHESDGMEADLSAPVLDSRTVKLSFSLLHPHGDSEAQMLRCDMMEGVYHTVQVPEISSQVFTMRYVSCNSFATNKEFDTIALTLAEDTVTIPTASTPDASSQYNAKDYGYTIDNINIKRYGCYVLNSTRASVERFANVKSPLEIGNSVTAGRSVAIDEAPHAKSRDITLNLHIHQDTVARFTTRWNALFGKLTSSGYRTLKVGEWEFKCYYKSMNVTKAIPMSNGGVWCDFNVTLTVCAYTSGGDWYYLTAENGTAILTEDGTFMLRIKA